MMVPDTDPPASEDPWDASESNTELGWNWVGIPPPDWGNWFFLSFDPGRRKRAEFDRVNTDC